MIREGIARLPKQYGRSTADSVIVIDDESVMLEFMSTVLKNAGYSVYEAGDGLAGLCMAQSLECQVVVADLNMPHIDGVSLCKELLDRDPDVRIVAVSGAMFAPDHFETLQRRGVRVTLTKPFKADTLLAAVEKALE